MSNVERFKSSFSEMARPNRFIVSGFGLSAYQLPYMAKGAQLPSASIGSAEAFYAGRSVKLAGDRIYPDWTITIYQDIESAIYNDFQEWQEQTLSHVPNIGSNEHVTYKRDGYVAQLDRSGGIVVAFKLIGAIPTELTGIDLAADSNDTPAEFTVTLAYDYFESINPNQFNALIDTTA